MTQHSINEAAKLVGRSPKTIYRLVKQGFLSATLDENGKKQIDTSELLRVFGELRTGRETRENPETISMSRRETPDTTARMALLEAELRHARELLAVRESQIEDLRRAVLLLGHRRGEKPRKFWPW
jgi:transposase